MSERTAQISFKITPELKAALDAEAEADGRSVSSLVMRICEAWVKDRGHLQEKAEKPRRR